MPRSDLGNLLSAFALYLVNVSQPITEADLADDVQKAHRYSNWDRSRVLQELRRALSELANQGYVRQAPDDLYSVTYSGIKLLSNRRMAFPRDKHRLYFLKEALRRRG
jgi:hypothetical protein